MVEAVPNDDSSSKTGSDLMGSNGRDALVDELSLAFAAMVMELLLVFAVVGSAAADGSLGGGGSSSIGSVLISSAARGINGRRFNLFVLGVSALFGASLALGSISGSAGTLVEVAAGSG